MNRQPDRPRGVVLLMSDEHCPFYSSVYGHPSIHTPNMDRLARMGTLFESAYCPSPLCLPARSAFISGRRVHELQTYNNCNAFVADHPTYGSVLRKQGVHTVHLGKVDVYNRAAALGFSEMLLAGDRKRPGDSEISRSPLAVRAEGAARARQYGPVDGNPFENDDRSVAAAIEWLTTRAPRMECPWVLQLNLLKPHFPHYVTPELWDLYPEGADLPRHGPECETARHPHACDLRRHFATDAFTEEQVRGLRRGYLGCVTYVDRQLGRLLDALEGAGLLEETLVLYTSDHGEMLGKFGMWWKCTLYEDAVRVPLIAAGPGFAPGTRTRTPVDLLDLQASLFRATGAERPEEWHGTPLQEIPRDDPDRSVFSEYHGHGTRGSAYMLRRGRWKLIHSIDAPPQLFDLEADPDELENQAERRPEVLRELQAELRRVCDPQAEHERAERFIRRQLEAMATAT